MLDASTNRIMEMQPNGPASQAEIRAGDIIMSVDGQGVTCDFSVPVALPNARPLASPHHLLALPHPHPTHAHRTASARLLLVRSNRVVPWTGRGNGGVRPADGDASRGCSH